MSTSVATLKNDCLIIILESVKLPAKSGGHVLQKTVVALHFCLLQAEQMEGICSEGSKGSGNRMRTEERLLEPFPSWQTLEIYVAAAADTTYAVSEAGGCVRGSWAAIGNNYRGIMYLPGEECRNKAEKNLTDKKKRQIIIIV